MKIYINGTEITLGCPTAYLSAALSVFLTEDAAKHSFAVALNGVFIGKAQYSNTQLADGDSIDVLFPIQGG